MAHRPAKPRLCPPLPWTVRLQLTALVAATDAAMNRDGTMNRFLFNLVDLKTPAKSQPIDNIRSTDITINSNLWVRIFSPSPTSTNTALLPVLVFFHGGGFLLLSAASRPFDILCRRFCKEIGAVVVSVSYRLSPEHRFPAANEDGIETLRFLDSGGLADLGVSVDLSSCFLVGDSAGGNIAHHVAHDWSTHHSEFKLVRLAGIVLMQPFFGGEERTASELRLEGAPVVSMKRSAFSWKAYLPVGADQNHPAAHVTEEAEIGERFPAAMVVVGGYDPLQDWQRRYYEVLKGKGKEARIVEYPDAIHGFYIFPEIAESGKLIEEMKLFVQELTSKSAAEKDSLCD